MCAKTRVYGIHEKPSCAVDGDTWAEKVGTKFAVCIDHAENEQTSHCRDHGEHLEREEPFELIWTEKDEWDVTDPVQKEC